MARLEVALRLLIEGQFVCRHRFPDEFEALVKPQGKEQAARVLEAIGRRLCQLEGPEHEGGGAFYMAYADVDTELRGKLREDLRSIRQVLHPTVSFLETVRLAQDRGRVLQPGETIFLDEMQRSVRENQALDQRLKELREVHNARGEEDAPTRLLRVLGELVKQGYLMETGSTHRSWIVTGKLQYLYAMLAFLTEHMPQLKEDAPVEQGAQQLDLQEQPAVSAGGAEEPLG